jgi:hypothetical protein
MLASCSRIEVGGDVASISVTRRRRRPRGSRRQRSEGLRADVAERVVQARSSWARASVPASSRRPCAA